MDIDQALFMQSLWLSQDAWICELLGIPDDPLANEIPLILALVLFENEDTAQIPGLFHNPVLFKVKFLSWTFLLDFKFVVLTNLLIELLQIECLIVYGPAAANIRSDNMSKLTHCSDSPCVQYGEFLRATFGFIAWIATIVNQALFLQTNSSA